jgi:DNA modification methylase
MGTACIDQIVSERFALYHGDCCEVIEGIPDATVGFSVFSPPFASLYTYSNSNRDMGNCSSNDEFWHNMSYLITGLHRITMPGRLCSVHCMNLPTMKQRDGQIGIYDFRGELIRAFKNRDWVFHSEVCIWKDPVTQMQRTKSLGLLHKQICKDSSMSRQAIPDYVCTFRKPDANAEPIAGQLEEFVGDQSTFSVTGNKSIDIWQRYASPVWMDINPSRTLQYTTARDEEDERHICPLQLDVIERCCQLWSNPDDIVFSPFAGIGSEGHVAVGMGRRFIGIELKDSYFRIAKSNLIKAEQDAKTPTLFEDEQ